MTAYNEKLYMEPFEQKQIKNLRLIKTIIKQTLIELSYKFPESRLNNKMRHI